MKHILSDTAQVLLQQCRARCQCPTSSTACTCAKAWDSCARAQRSAVRALIIKSNMIGERWAGGGRWAIKHLNFFIFHSSGVCSRHSSFGGEDYPELLCWHSFIMVVQRLSSLCPTIVLTLSIFCLNGHGGTKTGQKWDICPSYMDHDIHIGRSTVVGQKVDRCWLS